MLTITENNTTYTFPRLEEPNDGCFFNAFLSDIDENWRELDYKNGGHTLSLGIGAYYEIPKNSYQSLMGKDSKAGFIFDEGILNVLEGMAETTNALFQVELDINYTECDTEKDFKINFIGNLKKGFFTFEELVGLEFSASICKESSLYLGNNFNYPIEIISLKIGEVKNHQLQFYCKANYKNYNGEILGQIEIEELLSTKLRFKIAGYANQFVGKSIEDRYKELEVCFSSIYNIDDYELEKHITDKQWKGVQVIFKKK